MTILLWVLFIDLILSLTLLNCGSRSYLGLFKRYTRSINKWNLNMNLFSQTIPPYHNAALQSLAVE